MKKSLILLPLAALLLTGCGDKEEKYEPLDNTIPEGGEEINPEKEEQKSDLVDKLANNLKISYDSFKSGFAAEGDYNLKELSVIEDDKNFTVSDFSFKFKLAGADIDKTVKDWKILAEIKDLKAKIVLGETSDSLKKTIEASNINLGFYLNRGTLYADLSNATLVSIANTVIEYAVPNSAVSTAKQFASMLLKKVKITNFLSLVGASETYKLPELADKDINSLKNEIQGSFEKICSVVKFYNYEKNGLAGFITINNGPIVNETSEGGHHYYKESISASGNFVFNKDGQLAKVYMSEVVDNLIKEDEVILEKVNANFEEGVTFTYGASEITLPDFSSYEEFPIQTIMQLVGEQISSLPLSPVVPLPSPIVQPVED